MRSWRFGVGLVAAFLSVALVMSCAEERDPINRVQPNVIKKAMLQGEWYYHKKVVDTPGGMLDGFLIPGIVGWYADPMRVRFPSLDKTLEMPVSRINPTIDTRQRTVEVIGSFANEDEQLKAGMLVEVSFPKTAEDQKGSLDASGASSPADAGKAKTKSP